MGSQITIDNGEPELTAEEIRRGFGETRILWGTALFLGGMHALALVGLVYLIFSFSWWTVLLGVVWYFLCGFSITAGYHRLFAHRSYQASFPVRAALLAFGAAACQRSALKWCADHRVHHRHSDEPADPYSVRHGFWWAHFGWVISEGDTSESEVPAPRDLEKDFLVRFQHRHWLPLSVFFGGIVPAGIALLWGDPLGGLLVAGCLRVVLTWHSTYAVNSFAHKFGSRPYSDDDSARDNFWVALFTLGEGYHNFHHRFQTDYRNGVRWYHYDPTKWLVWTLSRFGLVRNLKRIPRETIKQARKKPAA